MNDIRDKYRVVLISIVLLFTLVSPHKAHAAVNLTKISLYNDNPKSPRKFEEQITPLNFINKQLLNRTKDQEIPVYGIMKCSQSKCDNYRAPPLKNITIEEEPVQSGIYEPAEEITETPEDVRASSDKTSAKVTKPKAAPKVVPKNIPKNNTGKPAVNVAADNKNSLPAKNKAPPFVYKYSQVDTSVVGLSINDRLHYDFEIIVWQNGNVSYPIKTLCELLDISYSQNHVNNSISFIHPKTGEYVEIDQQHSRMSVGNKIVEVNNPKIIFMKEGFLVSDDIFLSKELAEYVFDAKISFSKEKYYAQLETDRLLKSIEILDKQKNEKAVYEEEFLNAKAVKQNKLFNIKQLDIGVNSSLNDYKTDSVSTTAHSSNINLASEGYLLGGKYNVGTSSNYSGSTADMGNFIATLSYIGAHIETVLGSTFARLSDLVLPGVNLLGIRTGTLGAVNSSIALPRLITGRADDNTYVELFLNDVYTDRQDVEKGRFEFETLNYPASSFVNIRVEQVNPDGTRKIVFKRDYAQDRDLLAPKQKEFVGFSGIDSLLTSNKFSLFGKDRNSENEQPIKYITGFKYRQGITKRLNLGGEFAHSIRLKTPFEETSGEITSARNLRQSNTSSGFSGGLTANYIPYDDLRITTEAALSRANSKLKSEPNKMDFGTYSAINVEREKYRIYSKVFYFGSDYYSAGYSDNIDKRGYEFTSDFDISPLNFSASAVKYTSNLDKYFPGGFAHIENFDFNIRGKINDHKALKIGARSAKAKNSIYFDNQTDFNLTWNIKASDRLAVELAFIQTRIKKKNYVTKARSSSVFNRLNTSVDIDAGKVGIVRVVHQASAGDPEDRILIGKSPPINKEVNIKLDRSKLPWKNITVSPNVGYRYSGDKGFVYGVDVGYKNLSIRYSYNSSFTGGTPRSRSHAVSFNFTKAVNFGAPKINGANAGNNLAFNPENGIIKGFVYLDKNQNGIKDDGEEGIPDIDVKVKDMFNVKTDKKGGYIIPNLAARTYVIGLDKDTLPVIYTPTTVDYSVNVKREKVYAVNLGVIVTPGSISGKVNIENSPAGADVIVQLLNKEGKEVKYTTTDSTGGYYFGAVAPGEYQVVIDKNYLDYKGLQVKNNLQQTVTVPFITDDFYDAENIDFDLVPKQGEVKIFDNTTKLSKL